MLTFHSKIQIKAWHFLKPHDFTQIPGTYPSNSCTTCWWVNLLHWMSLNNAPTVPWRGLEKKCQPTAYAEYWACRHCSRVGTRQARAPACKDEARQKWILADGLDGVLHPLLVQWSCWPRWSTEQSLWETKKSSSSALGMYCSCHRQNGSII